MTKINYTKYIILGFLDYRPLSGYVIKKFVERSMAYFWQLGNGQIYPTLNSMLREGLITMQTGSTGLGPESKVYSLTDSGRAELENWLRIPEHSESFRSPMLLKLFFGGDSTRDIMIGNLREFIEISREKKAVMDIFERNYREITAGNPDHLYMYLTVLRGKMWYDVNIKWAEQAVRMLKKQ